MSNAVAAYQIPDYRLSTLVTRAKKLARKAEKLGMPAIHLATPATGVRVCYRYATPEGIEYSKPQRYELPCTWVELSGPAPVVNGHTFVARLEHTSAGNLVSQPKLDGEGPAVDLSAWHHAAAHCDHCGTTRKRTDTFLLRTPEGAIKQIGRNCLADFLRSADIEIAVSLWTLIEELHAASSGDDSFDGEGGGYWVQATSTAEFLAAACACVRLDGFRPASFDNPTKAAAAWLSGPAPRDPDALASWKAAQPTKEDAAKAILVRAWAIANTELGDYSHNLRIACSLDVVGHRSPGILASAVVAYDRAMGAEATRALRAIAKPSEYQGTVGKREAWKLTVTKVVSWDGQYGTTHMHLMSDENGNVFKWASSSARLDEGKTFTVRGTVKKHEEYKGTKQTTLSRCAAVPC